MGHDLVIVLAFDFTRASRVALALDLDVVDKREGTALHVAHVVTGDKAAARDEVTEIERQSGALEACLRRLFAEVYAACRQVAPPRVGVEVLLGDAVEELLAYASAVDAAWIAVGDFDDSPARRVLAPSVGQRLMDEAPCTVLRVRTNHLDDIAPADRPEPAVAADGPKTRSSSPPAPYDVRSRSAARPFSAWGAVVRN